MAILIKLSDDFVVHPNEIKYAVRSGNYTNVFLMSGRMEQIWDEWHEVWDAILSHTK